MGLQLSICSIAEPLLCLNFEALILHLAISFRVQVQVPPDDFLVTVSFAAHDSEFYLCYSFTLLSICV